MSEWHLKRARSRLQRARKIIVEMRIGSDAVLSPVFDLVDGMDALITAVDRKLNGSKTQPPPSIDDFGKPGQWGNA
jgi:hypothetical protein